MKVSLNWLKEYIDISDKTADELADLLDLSGTAVEGVEYPGKGLDKIVVGEVKEVKKHPNADKLTLVKVNVGKEIEIVCGAKNFKAGDKVPVALAGAVLPSGMEIKKAVIRGIESNGMLASELELNLGEDHSGIMILPRQAKAGQPIVKTLELDDYILDLEITPNRPDSMSMIGIAREVSALINKPYKLPSTDIEDEKRQASEMVSVDIKEPELCPRYTAKVIVDVAVGLSPDWMQKRLLAAGARPINNLVDITNYVLFELGQPLHAFDYELIPDGRIIVRRAKAGEKMITLDEMERTLSPENLVIADKNVPVALAGVMGGAGSEVNEQTRTILLESAYFSPKNIGRTSRQLGLISESSARFERGVDPNAVLFASERVCHLYQKLANGRVLRGAVDEYPQKINPVDVDLRPQRVNKVLGIDLKSEEIKKTLESLELKVSGSKEKYKVTTPTFRPDLEREIDLIEEVARLYELNKIESTLPESSQKQGKLSQEQKSQADVRNIMVSAGFIEALNYGFLEPGFQKGLNINGATVDVANPIVEDQAVMRKSLLPGLVKNTSYNLRRGNSNLKLFEIGYVFEPVKGDVPREIKRLAMMASGDLGEKSWFGKLGKADFYFLKGTLETLCSRLEITNLIFQPESYPIFEENQSAYILFGEEKVGYIGMLNSDIQEKLEIPQPVYLLEINYEPLIKYAKEEPEYIPVSKFPGITLDVALLVDDKTSHHEIEQVIHEAGEELLKQVRLFDLYTGKGIPKVNKSMAYSLFYQAFDRTLTTEEAVALHETAKKALVKELGAEIR